MNKLFGEKRTSSPSSRQAPAPPPSPVTNDNTSSSGGHGTNRHSLEETVPETSLPDLMNPPSQPQPSPTLRSLRQGVQKISPSLTLENSGSVARDHLASERTFLAYVRTSLAIASTGVALVQLFTISASTTESLGSTAITNQRIQVFARPLGATIVILGLFVLLLGLARYFMIQTSLTKGKFPVARVSIAFIAVMLSILVAIVFAILVQVRR